MSTSKSIQYTPSTFLVNKIVAQIDEIKYQTINICGSNVSCGRCYEMLDCDWREVESLPHCIHCREQKLCKQCIDDNVRVCLICTTIEDVHTLDSIYNEIH